MKFLKFDEIDSTNNYMKENISSFKNYDIVSAKTQTSGRGRRGNVWLSSEILLILDNSFSSIL